MTGSWTIDLFIIGCILLMIIPIGIWVYKEIYLKKKGDVND